jgi:uncharacterized tellurite resistance protein B-like protein
MMFRRLRDLLGTAVEEPGAEPNPERVRLATCVVLLEVAGADNEFSPEECGRIIELLRRRFDLSQEEAEELIVESQRRRRQTYDLWQYTNEINAHCTVEEKTRIIEEVWRVIYTDGALDAHEDYLVHKLQRLMNLTHPQLIAAKMKVLGELRGA